MLQRVSLQMFKYSRNTLPEVISELFITNDTFHSHNTRNKNKLRSKMSNREYIEGLELKRTISTFFKKWAKCTFLVLSNHTLRVRSHCILYLVKDA